MRKGMSPIVAVVFLIAISIIAAISIYFWSAGLITKQPTPEKPIPIVVNPVSAKPGELSVLVANLGEKPLVNQTLKTISGAEIPIPTIPPGEQKLIIIYGGRTDAGDVIFNETQTVYVPGGGSATVTPTPEPWEYGGPYLVNYNVTYAFINHIGDKFAVVFKDQNKDIYLTTSINGSVWSSPLLLATNVAGTASIYQFPTGYAVFYANGSTDYAIYELWSTDLNTWVDLGPVLNTSYTDDLPRLLYYNGVYLLYSVSAGPGQDVSLPESSCEYKTLSYATSSDGKIWGATSLSNLTEYKCAPLNQIATVLVNLDTSQKYYILLGVHKVTTSLIGGEPTVTSLEDYGKLLKSLGGNVTVIDQMNTTPDIALEKQTSFYVFYGDSNRIKVIASQDGENWSQPSYVTPDTEIVRSPSVVYDGTYYWLAYLVKNATTGNYDLYVRYSNDPMLWY